MLIDYQHESDQSLLSYRVSHISCEQLIQEITADQTSEIGHPELGIYKRKQESKKARKQELDQESEQRTKKTRKKKENTLSTKKKRKKLSFFLDHFFFVFFEKFPPLYVRTHKERSVLYCTLDYFLTV